MDLLDHGEGFVSTTTLDDQLRVPAWAAWLTYLTENPCGSCMECEVESLRKGRTTATVCCTWAVFKGVSGRLLFRVIISDQVHALDNETDSHLQASGCEVEVCCGCCPLG